VTWCEPVAREAYVRGSELGTGQIRGKSARVLHVNATAPLGCSGSMVLLTTHSNESRRRFPAARTSRLPCATVDLEHRPSFLVTPRFAPLCPPLQPTTEAGSTAAVPMPIAISDILINQAAAGHGVGTKRI
jgi:hypothetical protein